MKNPASDQPVHPDDVHTATLILEGTVTSYRLQATEGFGLGTHTALEFTIKPKDAAQRITVVVVAFADEGKTDTTANLYPENRLNLLVPFANLARFQAILREFKAWSLQVLCNPGTSATGLTLVTLSGQSTP